MHVMQREILHCTWWSVGCRQSRENKKKKKHKMAVKKILPVTAKVTTEVRRILVKWRSS
jgi:hypothetical protein